jgi:hypothetical protein
MLKMIRTGMPTVELHTVTVLNLLDFCVVAYSTLRA